MSRKLHKREIVEKVLSACGSLEPVSADYLNTSNFPELRGVRWRPVYLYRLDGKLVGIDIFHGDRVPSLTVQHMALAQERLENFEALFLVPEGEDFNVVRDACHGYGIDIITKIGDDYVRLSSDILATSEITPGGIRPRIPLWLVNCVGQLGQIDQKFRSVLRQFTQEYEALVAQDGGREEEEKLLKKTFQNLLEIDTRFAGRYEPLEILRWFESQFQRVGWRDHFFHSFVNFLLGCVVIDQAHLSFQSSTQECFPGTPDFSIEYAWLLTALFHDVGYTVERRHELQLYGDEHLMEPGEDQPSVLAEERRSHWKAGRGFDRARSQLVSIYEHLLQPQITRDWSADPFERRSQHALTDAMESSYIDYGSHGVASSLMMLAQIQHWASEADHDTRQFLCRHIYVAGLAILFHDLKFRQACRSTGIAKISSRRFPLATLLMIIDSVQDDRREETSYIRPDILEGLEVRGDTVVLHLNLDRLSIPEQYLKHQEVMEILGFVLFDGLRYQYPPRLTTRPQGISG